MNQLLEKKENMLMKKLAVLGVIALISWIATLSVWFVISDRSMRQETASSEIGTQWGRAQIVGGPILSIPTESVALSTTGERVINRRTLYLLPHELHYTGDLKTQTRSRGIYETPVYTATVGADGVFDLTDIDVSALGGATVLWDKAVISVTISDARGITSAIDLKWGDKTYAFSPSSHIAELGDTGIHTALAIDPSKGEIPFSFEIPLNGSGAFSVIPFGQNTTATLTSDWISPSFQGEFLPEHREVTDAGFTATWKVTSFGNNIPHYWLSGDTSPLVNVMPDKNVAETFPLSSESHGTTFGVALHQSVDFYTMVDRATKYSILFVALTFLVFFMYEMLAGLRIHPMQYLLVGLAIALFYLLLLSFSELLGFLTAYLISTTAVTLLISGYCASVLKAKKRALVIGALLIALYTYLYILLQLEELSLLFGSLLLFVVLAIVMYTTRNLNWYTSESSQKE